MLQAVLQYVLSGGAISSSMSPLLQQSPPLKCPKIFPVARGVCFEGSLLPATQPKVATCGTSLFTCGRRVAQATWSRGICGNFENQGTQSHPDQPHLKKNSWQSGVKGTACMLPNGTAAEFYDIGHVSAYIPLGYLLQLVRLLCQVCPSPKVVAAKRSPSQRQQLTCVKHAQPRSGQCCKVSYAYDQSATNDGELSTCCKGVLQSAHH